MRTTTLFRSLPATLALALVMGAAQQAAAQGTPPPTGGPTPAPTPVPIDGGASLLLAGSVAYGLRKLRQRRRQ